MNDGWEARRQPNDTWKAVRSWHGYDEGPVPFEYHEEAELWGKTHPNLHAVSVDRFIVSGVEGPNEEGVVFADYSARGFDNEVAAYLVCSDCGEKMTHLRLEWT